MKKFFYLKTFGCQLNVADSERIRRQFEKKGWRETKKREKAKLIIINSCLVRQSAENRVYGLINELRRRQAKTKIILAGCLAGWARRDRQGQNLRQLRRRLGPDIIIRSNEELAPLTVKPKRQPHRGDHYAYIPIANGCNQFCSYCIVPYARGREVYRPAPDIIKEAFCARRRHPQIMLLGQNVNSWRGKGKIKTFPQLLAQVAQLPGVKLVNFLSANPWDFSRELINVIRRYPNISRQIHLPLQSGDDEILAKMRRPYRARQYLALVKRLRRAIPEIQISTDIIVGFPGESEAAFQRTVRLCRQIGFQRAFIARYSPRPGTLASKLYPDDVPQAEKKRRWLILEKLINQRRPQNLPKPAAPPTDR